MEELRYSSMIQVFGKETFEKIQKSKIFCVGAGGIGCELLKNLVLSGFENIVTIDLDTIDVSNLNRQFLFRQQHVGQSKAQIATETALKMNPNCKITAYHGNIKDSKFGVDFYKEFTCVFNALDNVDARRHVNRMCLAADVPLIDGGTAGYLGQVATIKKDYFECYECRPKVTQKSFAVCTIRSNPTTIVHCVVWAKLLFERLYGKEDDSNAITSFEGMKNEKEFEKTIFHKVFNTDIEELTKLKEKSLWQNGVPISLEIPKELKELKESDVQKIWEFEENCFHFFRTCKTLKERREKAEDVLSFDKDDEDALDFVTAASNLRAQNFHIQKNSKFEIKAIAGQIVPAIATTNAIIAGLLIQECIKLINEDYDKVRQVDCLRNTSMVKRKPCLLYPMERPKPNKDCYVCQSNFLTIRLDMKKTTLKFLIDQILKKNLSLVNPMINSGSDLIYETGDDIIGEEKEMYEKRLKLFLTDLGLEENASLTVADFFQDINWDISLIHQDCEPEEFKIQGKLEKSEEKETDDSKNVIEEVQSLKSLKRGRDEEEEQNSNKK